MSVMYVDDSNKHGVITSPGPMESGPKMLTTSFGSRRSKFVNMTLMNENDADVQPFCLSPVAPSKLFLDDDDSRDSGFESPDSDTEMSAEEGIGLFRSSLKRSRTDFQDAETCAPQQKKPRTSECILSQDVTSEEMKIAVENMAFEADLVGDGSDTHRLPTTKGRHKDLQSVTPETVTKLLVGKYDNVVCDYQIIDCRYPYEYQGGHIEGAVNIHNETQMMDFITDFLEKTSTESRHVLIFHCEFSSERAPKLMRHLRNLDRKLNCDRDPFLYFPEMYLLNGGYKAFFEHDKNNCTPRNYIPMLHGDYSRQLRHFRVKSKWWTSGQKHSMRSQRMNMELSPLKF